VKPAPFDYVAATTLDEALALRAERAGDCAVLAGGQSLVPALNLRLARPAIVLDLNPVAELAGIRDENGGLVIAAMTRQREAERSEVVGRRCPLLQEALGFVGHAAIRTRGTVGGSLAHADPAAELPAAAAALNADLVMRGPRGERVVAAADFFAGPFATTLQADELLVEVRLPVLPPSAGAAFVEVARRHGDFALAGVAAVVTIRNGSFEGVRVALTGVGAVPVRVQPLEAAAVGQPATVATFRELGAQLAAEIDPSSDLHATADYRRRVVAVLVERALARAAERAG
jgi:carbon-monoxide dehydrogenase medium subunit